MKKPKREKEIEEYFNNITDEEFEQALINSNFEYYSKFKCFCMFYNVEEGCTWTPDFIKRINCCPIDRGMIL